MQSEREHETVPRSSIVQMSIVGFRATLLVLSVLGTVATLLALLMGNWRVALELYLVASVGLSLLILYRARWDRGTAPTRVRKRQPRRGGQMRPIPVPAADGGPKAD